MFTLLSLLQSVTLCLTTRWGDVASASTPTMPRPDSSFAVGSYNESIWLIGGYFYSSQLTEYRLDTDTFIDHGLVSDVISPASVKCQGQCWTQTDDKIYMIEVDIYTGYSTTLGLFDMKNKQYTTKWKDITMTTLTSLYSCLASVSSPYNYLFVVGGNGYIGYHDVLQILDLSLYEWLDNAPPMNVARGEHACVVHSGYLWAFGGYNGWLLNTNERIDIGDFTANTWQYVESFSEAGKGFRAVSAAGSDVIYIIGGWNGFIVFNSIHVIDAISGTIISSEVLPNSVFEAGTVLVQSTIYVFGGKTSGVQATDTMMYYVLNTTVYTTTTPAITTTTTSLNPTTPPIATATTLNPTFLTTAMETTEYITSHPTLIPTLSTSTIVPSFMASDSIHEATLYPTTNPVVYLTNIPSTNPSKEDSAHVEAAVTTRIPIATNNDEEISRISQMFSRDNVLVASVAVVLLVIVLSILCGIKRKKKKAVVQQIAKNLGGDKPKDICNPISPPNAATPNDQDVNDQDNEDSDDSDGLYEKQSGTTSGDNGTTRGNTEGEGVNKYEWIECRLKEYTDEWMTYLGNFKRHEIVDDLFSPPTFARTAPIWQELIPDFGVRIRFMDDVYS